MADLTEEEEMLLLNSRSPSPLSDENYQRDNYSLENRPVSPIYTENLRDSKPENISDNPVLTQKKQKAQDLYYSNRCDQSPLIRNRKLPVHQRLGKRVRFELPLGTNTFNVLPKMRRGTQNNQQRGYNGNNFQRFYQNNQRGRINMSKSKRENISRTYRAQNRINKIRHQQALAQGFFMAGGQRQVSGLPFRLRRTLPNLNVRTTKVSDMTIQVSNPRRFRIYLNPVRQAEIRNIQSQNTGYILDLNYRSQEIHDTHISLHQRFSSYI